MYFGLAIRKPDPRLSCCRTQIGRSSLLDKLFHEYVGFTYMSVYLSVCQSVSQSVKKKVSTYVKYFILLGKYITVLFYSLCFTRADNFWGIVKQHPDKSVVMKDAFHVCLEIAFSTTQL